MNINLATDIEIEAFAGATITRLASGITNGMIVKRDGSIAVTQRPSIDIFEKASDHIADAQGRAIFYWEITGGLYIVNNDTVYKNSQSNPLTSAITAGTEKCYMNQLGNYLVLVDSENDQGWTITGADVVAQITDVDFPSTLAPGIEVLNGRCYVLDEDGFIYGSDDGNPTSWSALNFVNAERAPDGGTFIGKHFDNLVVMGPRTMEFFYDAANPVGSVLNRRQDVFYNYGCTDGKTVWQEGDRTFFVGVDPSGAIGAYVLQGWQVQKISNEAMDSLLSIPLVKDGYQAVGAGFTSRGHTFYMLTFYYLQVGAVVPEQTYVYDLTAGRWYIWETTINNHVCFPIVNWTQRYGVQPRYGEGIMSNGDLITVNDDLVPQDSIFALQYVLDGYVNPGYVTNSGATGTNITMKARSGMVSAGVQRIRKRMRSLGFVGDRTINANDLTIRWADENSQTFSTGRMIDTSTYQRLNRLGAFRRRNFEVEYAGTDQIYIEALEW